jgi:hypothetical protein
LKATSQAQKQGLALRAHLGRSALADLPQRKFNPLDVLLHASKNRIAQLLPKKSKVMSGSTFAFFRGSVEIIAADLGQSKHTKIEVQLCGDEIADSKSRHPDDRSASAHSHQCATGRRDLALCHPCK